MPFWNMKTGATGPTATAEWTQIRCECGGVETVILTNLASIFVDRAGQVHEQVCGYRASCQRCGAVFSVSSAGRFQHDRRAFPLMPDPKPAPQTAREEAASLLPIHTAPKPRRRPDG